MLIEPEPEPQFSADFVNPTRVFGDMVVLELKFMGRFPGWFQHLVRAFGLRQGSASKYADGIALRGERFFCAPDAVLPASPEAGEASERKRERMEGLQCRMMGAAHAT